MKKENYPLYIAIGLPILFIAFISLLVFLPSKIIKSDYDFLYTNHPSDKYFYYSGYDNNCVIYEKYYQINADGSITIKDFYFSESGEEDPEIQKLEPCKDMVVIKKEKPDLYLYDFETATSRTVTDEEIATYDVVSTNVSPDGYKVQYRYLNSGLLDIFGGSNDNDGIFLIKNSDPVRRLDALTADGEYLRQDNMKFVGWINN